MGILKFIAGKLYSNDKEVLLAEDGGGIKSGSNKNGKWVKLPDGTLICTKELALTVDVTTSFHAIFESDVVHVGDYALPFLAKPVQTLTAGGNGLWIQAEALCTATEGGSLWLAAAKSYSDKSATLAVIAIGRWK